MEEDTMPTIVHFDIASDDVARAKTFYTELFGWKMEMPPGMDNYYLIDTKEPGGETGVEGGLGKRGDPSQRITVYIGVTNIDAYMASVEKLGGKVITQKMPVPGWGYLANCLDTEGNMFGLWQEDRKAG